MIILCRKYRHHHERPFYICFHCKILLIAALTIQPFKFWRWILSRFWGSRDWPTMPNSDFEQHGKPYCWSSDHIDYLYSNQWMEQTADGILKRSLETTVDGLPEQTVLLCFTSSLILPPPPNPLPPSLLISPLFQSLVFFMWRVNLLDYTLYLPNVIFYELYLLNNIIQCFSDCRLRKNDSLCPI